MKKVKVLHITTHNEDCGIAKYQEHFLDAMKDSEGIYNEIFPYSPNIIRPMRKEKFSAILTELGERLSGFDILHIQHELSFYAPGQIREIIRVAHKHGVKVVTTIHTSPGAVYVSPRRTGLGPRSFLHYLRQKRTAKRLIKNNIDSYGYSDILLAHSKAAKDNLIELGVQADKVVQITLPVPSIETGIIQTRVIRDRLDYKDGDILFASVGFVSSSKGVSHAVKALKLLPENYKLAIVGGVHPNGDSKVLDDITDTILNYDLEKRVYITGYIEDDKTLYERIGECDVCVYPYDKDYYAYVSSGAVSLALANHKATITYPLGPFIELNEHEQVCAITKSCNYYELARALQEINSDELVAAAKRYSSTHSYENEAENMVSIYRSLVGES